MVICSRYKYDEPCRYEHYRRPYSGCDIGVGVFNAAFGKYRRYAREKRGKYCRKIHISVFALLLFRLYYTPVFCKL